MNTWYKKANCQTVKALLQKKKNVLWFQERQAFLAEFLNKVYQMKAGGNKA